MRLVPLFKKKTKINITGRNRRVDLPIEMITGMGWSKDTKIELIAEPQNNRIIIEEKGKQNKNPMRFIEYIRRNIKRKKKFRKKQFTKRRRIIRTELIRRGEDKKYIKLIKPIIKAIQKDKKLSKAKKEKQIKKLQRFKILQ